MSSASWSLVRFELIAFLIIIVGMPIAVSSHGRIALNTVLLGLTLTTDQSLLELG